MDRRRAIQYGESATPFPASTDDREDEDMDKLITTLGPKSKDELGMILPHEHVFVDLRTWDQPGFGQADPQDVIELMAPEIEKAKAAGASVIEVAVRGATDRERGGNPLPYTGNVGCGNRRPPTGGRPVPTRGHGDLPAAVQNLCNSRRSLFARR